VSEARVLTGDGYQVYNLLASVLNTLQVRSTGVRYLTNRPVFWYNVWLTVSLKTGQATNESPVFYAVFVLTSLRLMTQHLITFNKILLTKGNFSCTKCTKMVFVFGRGSASDPAERATTILLIS